MIPKKQIEKLALSKLGPASLHEFLSTRGWGSSLGSQLGHLEARAPTRAVARAGLNAMLFALPKRRRPAR
jgi:hypothetical protein